MDPGKVVDVTPTKELIARSTGRAEDATPSPFSRSDATPNAPTKLSRPPQQRPNFDDEDEQPIDADKYKQGRLSMVERFDRTTWPHFKSVSVRKHIVLDKLKAYRDEYRDTYFKNGEYVEEDRSPKDPVQDLSRRFQVVDMSPEDVILKIEELAAIATAHGYYSVLSRKAEGSQIFSFIHESWVLLHKKEFKRQETKGSVQFEITRDLLTRIYKLCLIRKHMELREIYYTNTEIYKRKVAAAVDDVCCMIGCQRNNLFITASENGLIYGDISFTLEGNDFNCLSRGARGISIPSNSISITNIRSNSESKDDDDHLYFILVVEKDTAFKRLAEDGFCENYRCIMITGQGMPGVETRIILRKISIALQLPVYALMDGNPYGLRIYSVYRYGSKKMSYDSNNLTTPKIQLLGVQYSDINKFKIPAKHIEEMKDQDEAVARKLLDREHLGDYHHHLKSMIENKKKIQIEALNCHDLEYSAEVGVPMMIDDKLSLLKMESMVKKKIPIGALCCDNGFEFLAQHGVPTMVKSLRARNRLPDD